jgi:hypothetical protein
MQLSIHISFEKNRFHIPPDTLVTLTPSYPLVTFHLEYCFHGI